MCKQRFNWTSVSKVLALPTALFLGLYKSRHNASSSRRPDALRESVNMLIHAYYQLALQRLLLLMISLLEDILNIFDK